MTPVRKQPVPIATFRTSRPDAWNVPRQSADISTRGPIQSMPEEPRADRFDWAMRGLFIAITLAGIIFHYNGGFAS